MKRISVVDDILCHVVFTAVMIIQLFFCQPDLFAGDLLDLTESETGTNDNMSVKSGSSGDDIGDLRKIQKAFNSSKEFQNTLVYRYNQLSTYKIRLRTTMDTLLILPKNEVVSVFNLGDDVNFSFVPLKDIQGDNTNMGIIKNLHSGADTNLIVIGCSGNTYNFYLRIDDHQSEFLPHLKVYIEDDNIDEKLRALKALKISDANTGKTPPTISSENNNKDNYRDLMELKDYLRKIDNTPMRLLYRNQNLDFRYIIFKKGNVISPKAVFDDGYWTYFRMSTGDNLDKTSELPAILKVVGGIEQPVNSRVVRNYIIAETTGATFALRINDRVLCVEKRIDHQKRFMQQAK